MKYFGILLLCFACVSLYAQKPAQLQMMNGKVIEIYEFNDSAYTNLRYTYDKNLFKRERLNNRARRKAGDYFNEQIVSPKAKEIPAVMREGSSEHEEVFSVIYPDSTEKLFYYYNEVEGNDLPVESMRAFMMGGRDARVAITGKPWFYSGIVVGALAGYASRQSVLVLAVPPIFALTAKIPTIRIREESINNSGYQYNPEYAAGFESYARSKNIRQALKGSVVGTVIGLLAYTIVDNNR